MENRQQCNPSQVHNAPRRELPIRFVMFFPAPAIADRGFQGEGGRWLNLTNGYGWLAFLAGFAQKRVIHKPGFHLVCVPRDATGGVDRME